MAIAFHVSPRTMKRWLIDMGLSVNEPAGLRLTQRRRAFFKAMEFVNALKVYPPSGKIAAVAVNTFPFHENDLIEMIETRKYRGFKKLRREID